jgi:peptide/nickel transport system substrate-binding protein
MPKFSFRATLRATACALALCGAVAAAPVGATTFTWATANDILGLDPHANNHGVTNAMKSNVYETLVRREADGSLAPALAQSWQQTSPTTWRFALRPNVRFHGGEAFTAADRPSACARTTWPMCCSPSPPCVRWTT